MTAPDVTTFDDLVRVGFTDDLALRVLAYVDGLNSGDAKRHGFKRTDGRYAHFSVETKRTSKYVRVVMDTDPDSSYGKSVHAFIVRATGQVVKPAGWAGPAKSTAAGRKGEFLSKFSLTDDDSFAKLLAEVEHPTAFSGGYLYQY